MSCENPLLNILPDPAFFLENGTVTLLNEAARRLNIAEGQAFDDIPLPQDGEQIHLTYTLAGTEWEMTLQNIDGAQFALLRPLGDPEENLDLLLSAARGMQEPLTSMIAAGATLFPRLEEYEDESIQERAGAISRGFLRILRSVTAIRQYSQLQKEDAPLYVEKIRVKEFFDTLASKWKDALRDSDIPLEYQGPKNPFNGNLDKGLAQRAVLCLLSNAAAYRAPETPISLQISYMGNFVKIVVKNQGTPMAPDLLATAFSRYREPDTGVQDARQGLGLSLPLARRIAQRHGGSLLLQSSESGTTVTMTLGLNLPETDKVNTPYVDPHCGYDPTLVELSGILPNTTYDSRNLDL